MMKRLALAYVALLVAAPAAAQNQTVPVQSLGEGLTSASGVALTTNVSLYGYTNKSQIPRVFRSQTVNLGSISVLQPEFCAQFPGFKDAEMTVMQLDVISTADASTFHANVETITPKKPLAVKVPAGKQLWVVYSAPISEQGQLRFYVGTPPPAPTKCTSAADDPHDVFDPDDDDLFDPDDDDVFDPDDDDLFDPDDDDVFDPDDATTTSTPDDDDVFDPDDDVFDPDDDVDPTTTTSSTPTTTPIPSTVKFFCTFPNSPRDCGFFEQAKVPGRATIVNVGRDGPTGVRLHTEPGDNNTFGSGASERNDLMLPQSLTDGYEGREHWWAHSILFPTDYVSPPESAEIPNPWHAGVVFDFHNTTSGDWQANFHVTAMPDTSLHPDRPTGLNFLGHGGVNSGDGRFTAPIGPVARNVWYDFVYHVKWSSGSDGFIKAWVNGVLKLDHRGPTLYAGQGVYLKLANYHSAFGSPSSVIHDRIIRGTTWRDVSLTPLQGVN